MRIYRRRAPATSEKSVGSRHGRTSGEHFEQAEAIRNGNVGERGFAGALAAIAVRVVASSGLLAQKAYRRINTMVH
jgi:hypothetical protein